MKKRRLLFFKKQDFSSIEEELALRIGEMLDTLSDFVCSTV